MLLFALRASVSAPSAASARIRLASVIWNAGEERCCSKLVESGVAQIDFLGYLGFQVGPVRSEVLHKLDWKRRIG